MLHLHSALSSTLLRARAVRSLPYRAAAVAVTLCLSYTVGDAPAAFGSLVGVQTPGGLKSGTLFVEDRGNILDPFGPNYKASSNLLTGEFKAFAGIDSSNNNLTGFPFARANFTEQIFYTGTGPITLGFGAIRLEVDADFIRYAGFNGSMRNTASGNLRLIKPDRTEALAAVRDSVLAFSPSTLFDDPPDTFASGGAGVNVIRSDPGGLTALLLMPEFTLNPGDSFTISGMFEAFASATGDGNEAITDGFNTAKLSMTLPGGVSKSDFIFGEPGSYDPGWVSDGVPPVPEPATIAIWTLIGTSALGSHLVRRRKLV